MCEREMVTCVQYTTLPRQVNVTLMMMPQQMCCVGSIALMGVDVGDMVVDVGDMGAVWVTWVSM